MNILRFHRFASPRVEAELVDIFLTQAEVDDLLASETKATQWTDQGGSVIRIRVFPDAESAAAAHERIRAEEVAQMNAAGKHVEEDVPQPEHEPAIYVPGRRFPGRRRN